MSGRADGGMDAGGASLKVVVAAHKPYWMPKDACYVPVQVGAGGKLPLGGGFLRDDVGDNISGKNPNYCELTGLYWAWKNLEADYLGLAHYRRYFASGIFGDKRARIATEGQLLQALAGVDAVLPKPRRYYIETNYSHHIHVHRREGPDTLREVLADREPEGLPKYDEVMNRTWGHRFNMFVMRRDVADAWCEWLFDVLFELEGRLDIGGYTRNEARVFGYMAELLLDYWVEANGVSYREMPVVNLESQHWLKKGSWFVARKFRPIKHVDV